jgi:hypothetical protein
MAFAIRRSGQQTFRVPHYLDLARKERKKEARFMCLPGKGVIKRDR